MDAATLTASLGGLDVSKVIGFVSKVALLSPVVLAKIDAGIVRLDALCKSGSRLGDLASKLLPDYIENRLPEFHAAVQIVIQGLAEGPEVLKEIVDLLTSLHGVSANPS